MEKIQSQDPGSGMTITDLISENLVQFFRLKIPVFKFFDADAGAGSCRPGIRDGKIRIRDPGQTSRIRNTITEKV
jgi:hypothetical protein